MSFSIRPRVVMDEFLNGYRLVDMAATGHQQLHSYSALDRFYRVFLQLLYRQSQSWSEH